MVSPPAPRNEEFNRFMADMSAEIELLEHDLLGETYNPLKKEWCATPGSQLCNKKGAHWITGEIRARVNKNTFISDLTTEVIKIRVDSLMKAISEHLFFYGEKYDIEPETMKLINMRIADIVEFSLYRAKNAGERNYYGTTNWNVSNTSIQQNSDGFFQKIPFINKAKARGEHVL